MKYQIIYADERRVIVEAKNTLEIVKRYDLANRENIKTRVVQLDDEIEKFETVNQPLN